MTTQINCLAHGKTPQEPCEKREQCQRYLAFRSPKFPEGETIIGTKCVQAGHKLFVEVAK